LLGLIYWVTQEIPFSIPTTLSLQPEAKSRHTSRWSRRLGGRASPRDGFDYHPQNCSLISAKHPRNIQSPSRSYPVARSDTTHQRADSHSLVTGITRITHCHAHNSEKAKKKGFIYFSVTCCPQGEPGGNIPFISNLSTLSSPPSLPHTLKTTACREVQPSHSHHPNPDNSPPPRQTTSTQLAQ
jgi:hypothetical protein